MSLQTHQSTDERRSNLLSLLFQFAGVQGLFPPLPAAPLLLTSLLSLSSRQSHANRVVRPSLPREDLPEFFADQASPRAQARSMYPAFLALRRNGCDWFCSRFAGCQ